MNCPVCSSSEIVQFLRREKVPVHQNLLMKDQALAVGIARGDMQLSVCTICGFIFNSAFDPRKLNYGADYNNNQTCSPFFNSYVEDLACYLLLERGLRNCRIAEVGCGSGYFLRKLIEPEELGNTGCGFDPSFAGPAIGLDGRLQFHRRFYDAECARDSVDVVICRHVIEHVADPVRLLRIIRNALSVAPEGRVFFETPCAEWILKQQVLWDVFYEHCSYFTAESLATAFEIAGFQVERVQHIFGEQYLWLEATVAPVPQVTPSTHNRAVVSLCREFSAPEVRLIDTWHTQLRSVAWEGKVALWGAGAKGVTYANLLDPQQQHMACVVDLNPAKQGCFLPGTGHPIVSFLDLPTYQVKNAILMNPNYREENLTILRDAGLKVCLIDPMDWTSSR